MGRVNVESHIGRLSRTAGSKSAVESGEKKISSSENERDEDIIQEIERMRKENLRR